MGVGQAMSIDTIRKRLGRYPLRPVLRCLADVAARADHLALRQPERAAELAEWLYPPAIAQQAVERLRPEASPVSSHVVVNLALHALIACPDDAVAQPGSDLTQKLGPLILAMGDHLGRDRDDPRSFALEITRLGLFHTIRDLPAWLDLTALLFFEIIPGMTDDHDYLDPDAVIRQAHGMSLERFWALTIAQGVAAREAPSYFDVPMRVEAWNVSEDELRAWLRAWSLTPDEARSAAVRDTDHDTGWSFEAFVDAPLIDLGSDPAKAVAVRPAWLAAKATPAGMFWAVRYPFVADGGDHQQWSQFFGRAIEKAGRRLLDELVPGSTIITEDDVAEWGPGANCDAIVVISENLIALDFVFRQFTKASAGTGNFDDLAEDLRKAVVTKLMQVDGSLAKGLDGGHVAPRAIYPMVVVGGPFPLSEDLCKTVRELLAEQAPQVIGVHPDCRPPAMVDLAAFQSLLRTANALGCGVDDLLEGWLTSALAEMSFRDWLTTDGPGPQRQEKDSGWMHRAYEELGLKPGDE